MIEVSGLYKKYGTYLAVDNVSFSIGKGEVVGFLGPNGAGKSTVMNIITGYLSLTKGKVTVDGFDISRSPEKAKKRIGYLPELPPLYPEMTVREYLNFIYDLKKVKFPQKPHIDEIIKLVGLERVEKRLIKNLSKGYRQRVGFGQALVGNPDVIILDEPSVGLDPKQIMEMRALITRLGKNHTVILSSHILSEIQAVCERVIIINNGKLIADGNLTELSNKTSEDYSVLLRASGDEKAIYDALNLIEGTEKVINNGKKEDNVFEFSIKPQSNTDIREKIFDAVVSANGKVLSLTSDKLTLEQIFLMLTENSLNEHALELLKNKTGKKEEVSDESNI